MPIKSVQGKPRGNNIYGAMFDVRPITKSGNLDFEKIARLTVEVNLRNRKIISNSQNSSVSLVNKTQKSIEYSYDDFIQEFSLQSYPNNNSKKTVSAIIKPSLSPVIESNHEYDISNSQINKADILKELEDIVSLPLNVRAELARFGGRVNDGQRYGRHDLDVLTESLKRQGLKLAVSNNFQTVARPNYSENNSLDLQLDIKEPVLVSYPDFNYQTPVLTEEVAQATDNYFLSEASWKRPWPSSASQKFKLSDSTGENAENRRSLRSEDYHYSKKQWRPFGKISRHKFLGGILSLLLIAVGSWQLSISEKNIKSNVIQNGKNAVTNLTDAKNNLENLEFKVAADNFALAYDDFSRAGGTLDKIGASFAPVLKYIPGLNKISSAHNLIIAGQNIAKAGEDMTNALLELSQAKLSVFIGPQKGETRQSIAEIIEHIRKVFISSKSKVAKASGLLASIDSSILPEDKRQLFELFKDKTPELNTFLTNFSGYLDTATDLVPARGNARYLVLLQNNSELRATGGFPGSYALLTFNNGYLKEIKIDDSYNPDGQLRNNIIPPKPLQHITPTWGMRDANWFADFPTSAKKILEFYRQSTGIQADGLMTLTPDIIVRMLEITGPIEMPEYGLTLNSKNFLAQIQEKVESTESRESGEPKRVLVDFTPKFLDKVSTSNEQDLLKIFKVIIDSVKQKQILVYFVNKDAEKIIIERNLGGEVKSSVSDYLQVVISNVKGSKTDAFTTNLFNLQSSVSIDGSAQHQLDISRTHNGGGQPQSFYNENNPAYIRVYVPLGAQFQSIAGNDVIRYKPLVDYTHSIFTVDEDLAKTESGSHLQSGVDVLQESGKTVFGFWMIVKPGKTAKVSLKYKAPDVYKNHNYDMLWQKQSGIKLTRLIGRIELPGRSNITSSSFTSAKLYENIVRFDEDFDSDRFVSIDTN